MKYGDGCGGALCAESHPVRGAWIEMLPEAGTLTTIWSHPVRGAWIEICIFASLRPLDGGRTP